MKKTINKVLIALAIFWASILSVIILFIISGKTFTVGYYYSIGNSNMIITETKPILLLTSEMGSQIFDGLDIGDKIFVVHDNAFNESYPPQTGYVFLF